MTFTFRSGFRRVGIGSFTLAVRLIKRLIEIEYVRGAIGFLVFVAVWYFVFRIAFGQ